MLKLRANPARSAVIGDLDGTILVPDASYIDAVLAVLGRIDLDPCSSPKAQSMIRAQGWFRADQAEAALAEAWSGRVFLHPHPNARLGRLQIQKLLRDYLADRVTEAIVLGNRMDMLRSEPLLLSFPFVLHIQRLPHWLWDTDKQKLIRHSPSFNSVTHYLPAKDGSCFDDGALGRFHSAFSRYGRFILSEDYDGDDWQQQVLLASRRMPIAPVLTAARVNRHGEAP
jgi:hypothetical protein